MSTNAYDSEERINYSAAPKSYFGFYLSETSWSGSVHPFNSAHDRERFVTEVSLAAGFSLGDYDGRICAALAAFVVYDADELSESHRFSIEERYPAEAAAAIEAASAFNRNHEDPPAEPEDAGARALELVRAAVAGTRQYEDPDEEMPGADLVEWFGAWRAKAKDLIEPAPLAVPS